VGFLWPLFVQLGARFGLSGTGLWIGMGAVALLLGGVAQWRGHWI
jgi:hypothetical protein